MVVQGGQFLAIIFWKSANLLILCRFTDIVCLSFSVKQEYFPPLHIADKNCRRVELSSSVLLQTLAKLKSLYGTELSVVVVICLLGSF